MTIFKLKRDKFKSSRGGFTRLLNIYCRKCESLVVVYQKDGPGGLRRLYLDRIFAPPNLVDLQNKNIADVPDLRCHKCNEIIGNAYIYPKEKRNAFRLHQAAILKKVNK